MTRSASIDWRFAFSESFHGTRAGVSLPSEAVSEPPDGDGSVKPETATDLPDVHDDSPRKARSRTGSDDVPATRQQSALAVPAEPPTRPSELELRPGKIEYPDDGDFARTVRKIDSYLGMIEQGVLMFLFAALVVLTAGSAILEKAVNYRFHEKDDVIRACTFALAMIGGAFASHQAKHLSLDLVTRKFSPRGRLLLRIGLGVFAAFILVLFVRAGLQNVEIEGRMAESGKLLSDARLAWLIPVGAALMLVHTILHAVIDVDYAVRRKLPPAQQVSGH